MQKCAKLLFRERDVWEQILKRKNIYFTYSKKTLIVNIFLTDVPFLELSFNSYSRIYSRILVAAGRTIHQLTYLATLYVILRI